MTNSQDFSRRRFIKQSSIAGSSLLLPTNKLMKNILLDVNEDSQEINVSLFSKQVQFLQYKEMCEAIKEMGFNGVDLTIRPKGHVLPEKVEDDLPRATEAMKSFGIRPNLFTSNINDATKAIHKKTLETASKFGYKKYRTAWFKYKGDKSIIGTVEQAKHHLDGIAQLNKELGLIGAYQNHAGHYFGSGIWDLHQVLEQLSTNEMGSQYDIMHATVEGGKNWEVGFKLIMPYINSVVLKDFLWVKKAGKWVVKYVPIGEGMVDFSRFFSLLKENKIDVPFCIHAEYDLGGAEHGLVPTIKHSEVLTSIKKDLDFVRSSYAEA